MSSAVAEPPVSALRPGFGWDQIDGVWFQRDGAMLPALVSSQFVYRLAAFAREWGGDVLGANCPIALEPRPEPWRFARVLFLCPGRLVFDGSDGPLTIPPDIVVEVVSPNDQDGEFEAKCADWLNAGVRRVWLAVPETRRVYAFYQDGTVRAFDAEDTLVDEEILPGFAVPVVRLFPPPELTGSPA